MNCIKLTSFSLQYIALYYIALHFLALKLPNCNELHKLFPIVMHCITWVYLYCIWFYLFTLQNAMKGIIFFCTDYLQFAVQSSVKALPCLLCTALHNFHMHHCLATARKSEEEASCQSDEFTVVPTQRQKVLKPWESFGRYVRKCLLWFSLGPPGKQQETISSSAARNWIP